MPFKPASRVAAFTTSVFTEITQLAIQHNAVDLSTGFPDSDGPDEIKEACVAAIRAGRNQYALSQGERALRQAVAAHVQRFYGQEVDPETEVTVTNGAAEAMHSIMDGLLDPGDEVIIFEPFYEVFPPNVSMAGGVPRYVPLRPPGWSFDPAELAAAFNERTRAILVNSPHNPSGKVFSSAELEAIAGLCRQWDVIAIADEVYEHLVYDGRRHNRLASLPGMAERTLTVSSLSKTFSFTGWRIGWVVGPADLNRAVRLAHQFVLDCSATPMQYGAARALELDDEYYTALAADYQRKRDYLAAALSDAGLVVSIPASAFFIMAGIAPLGFDDDFAFCKYLASEIGVAAIPPSAFYSETNKSMGKGYARFAFCKTMDLLEQASERLAKLR